MWKDSIRNIVVIFQPNILRIVGFYVRHSAMKFVFHYKNAIYIKSCLVEAKNLGSAPETEGQKYQNEGQKISRCIQIYQMWPNK